MVFLLIMTAPAPLYEYTSITMSTQQGLKEYRNTWWGFSFRYPEKWFEWTWWTNVDISSFRLKDCLTMPAEDQIRITITSWPKNVKTESALSLSTQYKDFLYRRETSVGGENAVEFRQNIEPCSYQKETQRDLGIRNVTTYIIHHEGFTYAIRMEPSDSSLSTEFETWLSGFRFIKRSPQFIGRQESVPAKGFDCFQDLRMGCTFYYSDKWKLRLYDDIEGGALGLKSVRECRPYANEYIHFGTIDIINENEAEIEIENVLRKYPEEHYAASGSDGCYYCKRESVRLKKFRNGYGSEGYEIRSKIIDDHRGKISSFERLLVVFELKDPRIPQYRAVFFEADSKEWDKDMLEITQTFHRLKMKDERE